MDLDPGADDRGYRATSASSYHYETPEQRAERQSRNITALTIALVAALVLLALVVAAFFALGTLHTVVSELNGE